MRLVIAGGPRCGKTTRALELAEEKGLRALHSDDLIGTHQHGDDSAEVARWFSKPGPWVAEGVTMARGLRKWLEQHQSGKPCDEIILMQRPVLQLTEGQARMLKACNTVFAQIEPALRVRGVRVVKQSAGGDHG